MSKRQQPAKTSQLAKWAGDFGAAYAERHAFEAWRLVSGTEAFRRMLGGREVDSVLEVGCSVGLNLIFINALFAGRVQLYGVEPNPQAYQTLLSQPQITLAGAWNCDAFSLPMADASVDLAFTAGVLIHIAPTDLGQATDEIVRVAKRYVLCAEYFSHTPVEVPYRNHMGLLFKRDFGAFYVDRYPQLSCIDYGFLWQREYAVWDNVNWWLFEKP
ncbi:MAG TPA: pseudaminic acid biosynthesis-associated methylase [Candidatus Tectomicrobia bacterium]|jgi:pseudaminic acid biosynthesis-associated methylase